MAVREQNLARAFRQLAVGQARDRVLLMHDERNASACRHQPTRPGGKAAHADNRIRLDRAQHRSRFPQGARQHERRLEPAGDALAAQPLDGDVVQGKARFRHFFAFKTGSVTEPMHRGTSIPRGTGNGECRIDVPAGTARHHQNRFAL